MGKLAGREARGPGEGTAGPATAAGDGGTSPPAACPAASRESDPGPGPGRRRTPGPGRHYDPGPRAPDWAAPDWRGPDPRAPGWRAAGPWAPDQRGRGPSPRRLTSAKSSVPCSGECPRSTSAGRDTHSRRRPPSLGPATASRTASRTARPGSQEKRSIDLHQPCSAPLRDRLTAFTGSGPANSQPRCRGRLNNRSRSVARPGALVHALWRKWSAEIKPRAGHLPYTSRREAGHLPPDYRVPWHPETPATYRPERPCGRRHAGAGDAMRSLTSSWTSRRTAARRYG